MNRRDFLASGLGTAMVATAARRAAAAAKDESACATAARLHAAGRSAAGDPQEVRLNVKPVMTNILHSGVWEGPCRWNSICVNDEFKNAEGAFAGWSKLLREKGLGRRDEVRVLEPAHLTFSEDFVLKPEQLAKLAADAPATDAFFVYPSGSSVSAFEIGKHYGKPIVLVGLGCRNVDIAAYTRSMGQEAFVAADEAELTKMLSLLRARKVFRSTRVLFPTDRGLPASCSVGSVWDLEGLQKRLGVVVKRISYKEMAEQMKQVLSDAAGTAAAEKAADDLVRRAQKVYLEARHVARSLQFYQAVRGLMDRHGCNAFTIECFEFCSSRLPDQWKITPCLIHALLKDQDQPGSCEGDLGSLLAMRMLMSVSRKSCHQGNSDPTQKEGVFQINHSAPAFKMNGYGEPDLPYELGRFVSKGWGTKVVIDFMNHPQKTVTVARVNPAATKVLVLRGELVGANGWGKDLIGCSVEAQIRPPKGRADEFMKRRLEYGNHLQWVYGDYTEPLRQLGEMLKIEVEVIA